VNGIEIWKPVPVFAEFFEVGDDVADCGSAEEVLLLDPVFNHFVGAVLVTEYFCNLVCLLPISNCCVVVALVEAFQVKFTKGLGTPESDGVAVVSVEPRHCDIVGHRDHLPIGDPLLGAVRWRTTLALNHLAAKLDHVANIIPRDLPWITLAYPEVRHFHLHPL
jgi:hypothetical protein